MSKHLKRLNAPRILKLHRKERNWTIRVSPGSHSLEQSIPLGLIVRDYFNLADTLKETKRIISEGEILVDGIPNKNYKHPCGLMDVISIDKMKKDLIRSGLNEGLIEYFGWSTTPGGYRLRYLYRRGGRHGHGRFHHHFGSNSGAGIPCRCYVPRNDMYRPWPASKAANCLIKAISVQK